VPRQQEKADSDCKPGHPGADLKCKYSQDEKDDSDREVFARQVLDDPFQA
jgi:hypothetical protein